MSWRIFKLAGPAYASATAGGRAGSDLQPARRIRQNPRKGLTSYFTVPDNKDVPDPLACGDCSAIICRQCGTPLERVDELGIG
jgi:hypothetical protein